MDFPSKDPFSQPQQSYGTQNGQQVIEFHERNLTDTMIQFTVRRNLKNYIRTYQMWIGCYLLSVVIALSLIIIIMVSHDYPLFFLLSFILLSIIAL